MYKRRSNNYVSVIEGTCKKCGSDVIRDQPKRTKDHRFADYWFHCTNPDCKNFKGIAVGENELDNVTFVNWNQDHQGE